MDPHRKKERESAMADAGISKGCSYDIKTMTPKFKKAQGTKK